MVSGFREFLDMQMMQNSAKIAMSPIFHVPKPVSVGLQHDFTPNSSVQGSAWSDARQRRDDGYDVMVAVVSRVQREDPA